VSKTFYSGSHAYDPETHKVITDKGAETETKGKQYAQMLWKASTIVGFGQFDGYVVARYCTAGNGADEFTADTSAADK
jgi:hypothetical protein